MQTTSTSGEIANKPASKQVFIGWSGGELGFQLGDALRKLFGKLGFQVFCSTAHMQQGDAWFDTVETQLANSCFGVFVVTPGNWLERWLYYEIATLRSRGLPSCPILFGNLDASDLKPPLSQLQSVRFNRDNLLNLVMKIAKIRRPAVGVSARKLRRLLAEMRGGSRESGRSPECRSASRHHEG